MSVNYIVILRASGIQKSNELEDILKDCNYKIITFPILKIEQLYSKPIQLTNAQALLTTSSNAIQLFSELSKNRTIPIYTVGSSSKNVAKKLGYKNVIDCQGDSVKMYQVILDNCSKNNGELIYIGAKNISLNLPRMLQKNGYKVKRYIIYKTKEVDVVDKKFLNLIKLEKVKWIVLLSKKGASNFNKLIVNDINFDQIKKIKFACLSENIARELSNKIKLKFFPTSPILNKLKSTIMQNE